MFGVVPVALVKTLTVDNDKEFTALMSLREKLGCPVYFVHPYHSWERGLNDHPNGLPQTYLSKCMSFDRLIQRQLDTIVHKINNRPRKSLGYRTPAEVFSAACIFVLQI
jgi:IS30 family transposase